MATWFCAKSTDTASQALGTKEFKIQHHRKLVSLCYMYIV